MGGENGQDLMTISPTYLYLEKRAHLLNISNPEVDLNDISFLRINSNTVNVGRTGQSSFQHTHVCDLGYHPPQLQMSLRAGALA